MSQFIANKKLHVTLHNRIKKINSYSDIRRDNEPQYIPHDYLHIYTHRMLLRSSTVFFHEYIFNQELSIGGVIATMSKFIFVENVSLVNFMLFELLNGSWSNYSGTLYSALL